MPINKIRIKRSFSKASLTYDNVAELQRTVGKALLNFSDMKPFNGTLLDLGCGTGFLTKELLSLGTYKTLIALDIALSMLQTTQNKLTRQHNVSYICADAEYLPLVPQSIDHVFSNLALQWCDNLEAVFTGIKGILKPKGQLVFSTFGPETLCELKQSWSDVDHYNHVNTFYSDIQIHHFLQQAGFTHIEMTRKVYTSHYESVWVLMQELKHLGAHHVISGGNKKITTKKAMQQMIAAYERFRCDGQLAATFEVISVIAKV